MDENVTDVAEVPVEEEAPPPESGNRIEVDPSWKQFDSDPTPFLSFSKEVEAEVDGDKVRVFIRLPNQWQHRKVQEHAAAARARMVMQLRDPNTDSSAIIEEQLLSIEDLEDDKIIEWLLQRHAPEAVFSAQLELETFEDTDANGEKFYPWANMFEHQERYAILVQRQETDSDEFRKLEEHVISYAEAIQERANHHLEPKEQVYAALDREGLMDKARRALRNARCMDEFINVYNQWQIYYGTRKLGDNNRLYFKSFGAMLDADTGIIELLTAEFATLDALKAGELGKSPRATSLSASLERSEN